MLRWKSRKEVLPKIWFECTHPCSECGLQLEKSSSTITPPGKGFLVATTVWGIWSHVYQMVDLEGHPRVSQVAIQVGCELSQKWPRFQTFFVYLVVVLGYKKVLVQNNQMWESSVKSSQDTLNWTTLFRLQVVNLAC